MGDENISVATRRPLTDGRQTERSKSVHALFNI